MPEVTVIRPVLRRVAPAVVLLALQSCIIVPLGNTPGPGYLSAPVIASINEQRTRANVLMTLGAPDRRFLDDRVFGYRWTQAVAAVIVAGGYSAGGFTIDADCMLLIEFSDDGELRRAEVVRAVGPRKFHDAVTEWLGKVHEPASWTGRAE